MTLKEAYNYGVYFLSCNGIDEAEFKSLTLVCHLAGIKNSEYQQHINDDIVMKKFADLLWRVKSNEPLQYIVGKWDFYNSEFAVGPGVLIPRPETEELTQLAIDYLKNKNDSVVYDLCAGSGCIGISIAKECADTTVYLIEKSKDALFYLKKNAQGINNVHIIEHDIAAALQLPKADLIISNPPYIKSDDIKDLQSEVLFEPEMALDGGADGLDFYRIINDNWTEMLNDDGILLLEIGEDQGEEIINILNSYKNIKVIKDMYGNDRMVKAIKE